MSQHKTINFEGLEVTVYRDTEDDLLTVQVLTHDTQEKDQFPDGGVPKLRLVVNDSSEVTDDEGGWIKEDP